MQDVIGLFILSRCAAQGLSCRLVVDRLDNTNYLEFSLLLLINHAHGRDVRTCLREKEAHGPPGKYDSGQKKL